MAKYDRLTIQKLEDIDLKKELDYSHIYKRLHELEDKIESGELVSKRWHDEQVLHAEIEIGKLKEDNEILSQTNYKNMLNLKMLSDEIERLSSQNIRFLKIIENITEKSNNNCKENEK